MKTLTKNKITVALLAIILIVASALTVALFDRQPSVAHASEIDVDAKIYSRASIEENFADNTVLVVLNGQATRSFKQYTAEDFAEVDAVSVTNLSAQTGDLVKRQINAERTGDRRAIQQHIDSDMLVNIDIFRTILMIQLNENGKENVLNAIRILEQRDDIVSAEPNYYLQIGAAHPNSANLRNQWAINNIQLEDAWDISTGSANVLVGVIDTGIDGTHPDLENRLQRNLCAEFNTDFWGIGVTTTMTPNPTDSDGHGTHLAGIIGAQGVNNGITGVNQNIRLVSLRIYDNSGNTTVAKTVRAIDYAQDNNIPILNLSSWNYSNSNSLKNAISGYSGLFVCIAGNGNGTNINTNASPNYPGSFGCANQITVGSIDNGGAISSFSNIGSTAVHIFAPGGGIISTVPTVVSATRYATYNGTSMAAPYVAGVAALMRATNPNLTTAQIKSGILDNVTIPMGTNPYQGNCTTNGRLNALNAINAALFDVNTSGVLTVKSGAILPANLVIPEQLNGRTVTQIGNAAFANQTQLSQITIPASVTSIGANAFQNCTSLSGVVFDSNSVLTSIGNSAFAYCNHLTTITIPADVIGIGTETFKNCTRLQNIYFDTNSNLTYIQNAAFANCGLLTSITIPSGVTGIGTEAFINCSSLAVCNFTEDSSCTSIGNSAFENCELLYFINIPSSLTNIGTQAFKNCSTLTSISFFANSNLSTIQNAAFAYCTLLPCFDMPWSLTSIGYDAFLSCTGMTSTIIHNNVTTIGGNAFSNCTNLTIYTSRSSFPSGWVSGWNVSNRPVVKSCALSFDEIYYVTSFPKSLTPLNPTSLTGIQNPYRDKYTFGGWYENSNCTGTSYSSISSAPYGTLYAKWTKKSCVAEGTLITLADGSEVAVEQLTGNESLLVWNLFTGTFDSAPIIFIDSDPLQLFDIIRLTFSDGTEVKVIDEHAFWNFDLNQYVFLRSDAEQYIGHWFHKQTADACGALAWTAVQLTDVELYWETTTSWSPVTYGHLCYYVNGMLSMPGATEGLINIFDVDPSTMKIDEDAYLADIAEYGLLAYEDVEELMPEAVFDAFNGQYLLISIGKGLITWEDIYALLDFYAPFFEGDNTESSPGMTDNRDPRWNGRNPSEIPAISRFRRANESANHRKPKHNQTTAQWNRATEKKHAARF